MSNQTKTLTVGADAGSLDIFLSDSNNVPVSANYVGFEFIDSAGSVVSSGIASNPSVGKYTASGVIPAVLQTVNPGTSSQFGTWKINWDIITASNTFQQASESFCVQGVNVKIGFTPESDKTYDIYDAIRIDLGADDGTILSDDLLERTLKKAVRRLNHTLGISNKSRPRPIFNRRSRCDIQPIVFNAANGTITPDNDEICDLVVMQSEVILLESEVNALKRLQASGTGPFAEISASASQDGISVTNADGVSVNISGGRLANRVQLYKFSVQNANDRLNNAVRAFLSRMTANFGKIIY